MATKSQASSKKTASRKTSTASTTTNQNPRQRHSPRLRKIVTEEDLVQDTTVPSTTRSCSNATAPQVRISKRWILVSIVSTLIFGFYFFPWMFPKQTDALSDALLESALMQYLMPKNKEFFWTETWKRIRALYPTENAHLSSEDIRPGRELAKQGLKAKHPVIFIPGVISTGLEVWQGRPCAESYFRQRLWTSTNMLRMMLTDKECWIEHMRLDPVTFSDPSGIKIRAAQGLEAADFWLPGMWVFAKIIENLAQVGYDSNSMYMASYDWRTDMHVLEGRDKYFTRLKKSIEWIRATQSHPLVIMTHSHGSLVAHQFMKWVEADPTKTKGGYGGSGGPEWVNHHIHAIANMAGPMLGVVKGVSVIISAEARDTAMLGKFESFLLDKLLNKKERASLFRTWVGGFSMIPKGGLRIWGGPSGVIVNNKSSKDEPKSIRESDEGDCTNIPGQQTKCKNPFPAPDDLDIPIIRFTSTTNHSVALGFDEINERILDLFMPSTVASRVRSLYSTGMALTPDDIRPEDWSTWSNPLESTLPNAPNMTIYSMYGYDVETEKGYEYRSSSVWHVLHEQEQRQYQGKGKSPLEDESSSTANLAELIRSIDSKAMHMPHLLDLERNDQGQRLHHGIYHVDGDGTVPLISLGYLGIRGWRDHKSPLNPHGVRSIVREYRHDPVPMTSDIRGGPKQSDHVGILWNHEVISDLIKIACGIEVEERVLSGIKEMADRVNLEKDKSE